MKSYFKNILPMVMLVLPLFFAGCKDDFDIEPVIMPDYSDSYFVLNAQDTPESRVSYNELVSTFEDGDIVGVFALNEDLSPVEGQPENVQYIVTSKTYTGEDSEEYKVLEPANAAEALEKHKAKYLFYYPYAADMTYQKIQERFDHTVKSDQSKKEDYEASDLLWTVEDAGNKKYVNVVLDHAMALITVTIDEVNFDPDNGASVLNVLPEADGVSLLSGKFGSDNAIDRTDGGYTASGEPTEIKMYNYAVVSTGHEFRAAVPAQTLAAGTQIIKVGSKRGNKTFSLRKDLKIEAGYNYRFRVSTRPVPIPDYGDEDSWVLDVLDPETGKQVGLLCREYIRYQPQNTLTGKNSEPDQITFPYKDNKEVKINIPHVSHTLKGITMTSQAWVFYNMDGNSPDLTKGQILRVICDVRSNVSDAKTAMKAWPAPYKVDYGSDKNNFGDGGSHSFNCSEHGHNWIADETSGRSTKEDDSDKEKYGKDGDKKDQYYYEFWDKFEDDKYYTMHGSRIKWCPEHKLIYFFELYGSSNDNEVRVSNQVAKNQGHIAIPGNGDSPYVSFEDIDESNPIMDIAGNKVGFTVPHYLIDTRSSKDGKLEITRYPIVKIGYNQFWMSKSLRTRYLNDDAKTSLQNYSNKYPNINDFHGNFWFDAGFIYPAKYTAASASDKTNWDVDLLYNTNALLASGFVPISQIGNEPYKVPEEIDIKVMWDYLGWRAYNKLMTGDIAGYDGAYQFVGQNSPKTIEEAFARGFFNQRNGRCANVAGFNLKASGYRDAGSIWANNGDQNEDCTLLLLPSPNSIKNVVLRFHAQDFDKDVAFDKVVDPNLQGIHIQDWDKLDAKYNQGAVFAPVRLFMSFQSQNKHDCYCSKASTANPTTRSRSVSSSVSRDVYVGLMSD